MTKSAICVYCASNLGNKPEFLVAATSLGEALANEQRPLVYGGGVNGLMGAVSTACRNKGGKVTGVVPRAIANGGGEGSGQVLGGSTESDIIVNSMHERKTTMASLADGGFIALPGGFGTLEEVLEAITWSQIGIHQKPVVLINVLGYFEPLRTLFKSAIDSGLINPAYISIVTFVDTPDKETGWGGAAIRAIDEWKMPKNGGLFNWTNGSGKTGDHLDKA